MRTSIASGRLLATAVLGLGVSTVGALAQSRSIDSYVLLARDGINTTRLAIEAGDVVVLDGSVTATREFVAPASTVAAPMVRMPGSATCAGVRAATLRGSGAACATAARFERPFGTVEEACGFPDPFPACDATSPPIVVPHGATLALPPGTYGDVRLEGGAGGPGTLVLAGTYRLCTLRAAREAVVRAAGPTTLYVEGALTGGNATRLAPQVGVGVDELHVFVAGSLVRFTRRAGVAAMLCAPRASIRFGSGVSLQGRIAGADIRMRQADLRPAGAPTSTTTTTLPAEARCGDGVVQPGEVCDGDIACTSPGGSFLDCSACTAFTSGPCTPSGGTRCGDGTLDPGEACDDGNTADCDGCSAECSVEAMGNGRIDCDEECDDGNLVDCDGCDAEGIVECGNGTIDVECGEVCDGANVAGQVCGAGRVACRPDCRAVDRTGCPADAGVPQEVCGNCIDDDLNGLIDFEDPVCCGGAALSGARLDKVRLAPRRHGTSQLRLRATLRGDAARPLPSTRQLILQARSAGGPGLLCARLPAGALRPRRAFFRFRDRQRQIASAQSLDVVKLRRTRSGLLRLKALGRRMPLALPAPGPFRVTVALVDPTGDASTARCAELRTTLRPGRRKALRGP